MKPVIAFVALLAAVPADASAQTGQPVPSAAYDGMPTNTEVLVTLNDELNSSRVRKGQLFDVSVSRDVMVGGRIVIPRGAPGKGEIVYRTGKGAFGKSGKLELVLRSLDVNGRTLPLTGRFHQEGQGNTGAVLGTVVLAGVVAGAFVTGHSAVIEQGREFKAFTAEALPPSWPRQIEAVAVLPALGSATPTRSTASVQPAPILVAVVPTVPAATSVVFARPKPVVVPAPAPIIASVAAVSPGVDTGRTIPAVYASRPPHDAYQRALVAQQGVRGHDAAQGWSISD